jgi:hypothetical protein
MQAAVQHAIRRPAPGAAARAGGSRHPGCLSRAFGPGPAFTPPSVPAAPPAPSALTVLLLLMGHAAAAGPAGAARPTRRALAGLVTGKSVPESSSSLRIAGASAGSASTSWDADDGGGNDDKAAAEDFDWTQYPDLAGRRLRRALRWAGW